jgi:uncharacterized protein (DUF58 family)
VYPLATPRLVTGFPFGLWAPGRPVTVVTRLVVWPRTYPVGPVPTTDGDEVVEGNVTRNRVGSTGDVLGVRPYRRGDSPRRIHWPQSAKHDRLVVCELQSNSRPVVLLVLDADPAVHTPGPDGSREWAVRVVASLARGWLEAGAQVGAAWDGLVVPPASGAAQVARILDALARLPDSGRRSLAEVLRSPGVRAVRAAVRVAVTTDAGLIRAQRPTDQTGVRWVVLDRRGFPGSGPDGTADDPAGTCDEAPDRTRPAWVEIPGPGSVPHRLRYGWSEARHGS